MIHEKKRPGGGGNLNTGSVSNPFLSKDQNMNAHTPTPGAVPAASENRDIGDAIDIISRAISINDLIFEAAHRLEDRAVVNAFVEGSLVVHDFLADAKAVLYANIEREGGDAWGSPTARNAAISSTTTRSTSRRAPRPDPG
ncbi:MAG: hypothetical protein KF694_08860 [Mesorhizobium sp.]|nr:hypothetical protein [Mesorhizobium sp.]